MRTVSLPGRVIAQEKLVGLLREDATVSMPPGAVWLRGAPDIARWWNREGVVCRGSRLVPVAASGSPAVAQYRPRPVCPGELRAFAIQVLTIADDGIAAIDSFLQPELFGLFDLPPVLPSPAINP